MSYSSYQNQQQMAERIEVLEKCVAMLVRLCVDNWSEPEASKALHMFADKIIDQHMAAKREEAHAVEDT